MVRYYLQLIQPSGNRSHWRGGYKSKKRAREVAQDFRKRGWKVRITTKKTKYNWSVRGFYPYIKNIILKYSK